MSGFKSLKTGFAFVCFCFKESFTDGTKATNNFMENIKISKTPIQNLTSAMYSLGKFGAQPPLQYKDNNTNLPYRVVVENGTQCM